MVLSRRQEVRMAKVTFFNSEHGIRLGSPRGKRRVIDAMCGLDLSVTHAQPALTRTGYCQKIPTSGTARPLIDGTPIFRAIAIENLT
jgi:hypothetical protein